MSDERRTRVGTTGTQANPHAHLDPVVEAELAWGNRLASRGWSQDKLGECTVSLREPLHLDLLRATFRFPPSITLHSVPSRGARSHDLVLEDPSSLITVRSPVPEGCPVADTAIDLTTSLHEGPA